MQGLGSMVYKLFDKQIRSGARTTSVNKVLAQKLDKPAIRKFKRRKVYSRFEGNIWAGDLAKIRSLSSKNQDVKYL